MWTRLFFAVLVAASAAQAWTPETEYTYTVQSRTLAALHQVGDQYSGMLMKGKLFLYAKTPSKLYGFVADPEYANVNQALPQGWTDPMDAGSDGQNLQWQQVNMSKRPFTNLVRNGIIERLVVGRTMPGWEINMIKGIISQIQVDAKAENYFKDRINQLPSDDSESAAYKTMEDTITGKCEVLYDISPLPEYVLQSHPELVPFPKANPEDAQTLEIVKTTNYSNCAYRPVFHQGFSGENDWEPASSKMGQFFAIS